MYATVLYKLRNTTKSEWQVGKIIDSGVILPEFES